MEGIVVLILLVVGVIFIGGILGMVAMARVSSLRRSFDGLEAYVRELGRRLTALEAPHAPEPKAAPTPAAEHAIRTTPRVEAERKEQPAAGKEEPVPQEAVEAIVLLAEEQAAPPAPAEPSEVPAWRRPISDFFRSADWAGKFEEVVGKRWMTWAGGLALFAAVGFFVKYAIDNQWISPAARIIAGLVLGTGIIAAGDRFVRRGMRQLGLGLIGAAGLPILYVSLFAGFHFYTLLPQPVAFGAMILVTVAGMSLAVLHDSLAVSFLAVLGGLLTPLLVSTGQDARDALFAYLLMLDLGVLAVAFVKQWRALDVLAFLGTAGFYAGWFAEFYRTPAMVPALLWLGAFYLAFLVMPFAYHLRARTPATLERFLMGLVVGAAAFGYAYTMLHPGHDRALGFVALAMGACYVTIGSLARRRVPADARGVFGFIALALVFLTIAVPLQLKLNGITLGWAAEAVALLYLGYRFAYRPVRFGAFAVLMLAVARVFLRHGPSDAAAFDLILNARFGVAAFACAAAGAFAVVHERWREAATAPDRTLKIVCAIGAGVLGLIVLHGELGAWFASRAKLYAAPQDYLWNAAGVGVWAAGSLALLAAGYWARCLAARLAGVGALAVAAVLLIALYTGAVPDAYRSFLNARFLVALAAAAAAFGQAAAFRRWREAVSELEQPLPTVFGLAAGLGLLLAVHVDLADWLMKWGLYQSRCGVTALWAAGAMAFLAAGLAMRSFPARVTGLIVLGGMAVLGMLLYENGLYKGTSYFANARFAVAFLGTLAVFGYGFALRYFEEVCYEQEEAAGDALYVAGGFALLLVLSFDLDGYLGLKSRYLARCGVAALWALGSAAFLAAGHPGYRELASGPATGRAWRSAARRGAGLAVLAVALLMAAGLYKRGLLEQFIFYVNLRFAVCLLTVGAVFAFGYAFRRFGDACAEGERRMALPLLWLGGALLLLLLSVDPYLYAVKTAPDPQRARWSSQMALSIIWSCYAVVLLGVGFWKRLRAVRLTALGLFGLTALKLVIVDIAHIQQIYRILSFLVLGVLMIGASYLYHRIEKRLEEQWGNAS